MTTAAYANQTTGAQPYKAQTPYSNPYSQSMGQTPSNIPPGLRMQLQQHRNPSSTPLMGRPFGYGGNQSMMGRPFGYGSMPQQSQAPQQLAGRMFPSQQMQQAQQFQQPQNFGGNAMAGAPFQQQQPPQQQQNGFRGIEPPGPPEQVPGMTIQPWQPPGIPDKLPPPAGSQYIPPTQEQQQKWQQAMNQQMTNNYRQTFGGSGTGGGSIYDWRMSGGGNAPPGMAPPSMFG